MTWNMLKWHGPCWNDIVHAAVTCPCCSDMVYYTDTWSILQWHSLRCNDMVFAAMTWSMLQLHDPCCSDMVHAIVTWSLLQRHGPCCSDMVHAEVTWSLLQGHGFLDQRNKGFVLPPATISPMAYASVDVMINSN